MHAIPNLQWKTWVRLALVEAGSDWRSLNKLRVVDGRVADYLIVPEMRNGILGVTTWNSAACSVTGRGLPNNGTLAVADARLDGRDYHTHDVLGRNESQDAVMGHAVRNAGVFAVADPGVGDRAYHATFYRVVPWNQYAGTITGAGHTAGGAPAVADPRMPDGPNGPHFNNVYRMVEWSHPSATISSGNAPCAGGLAVADPRPPVTFTGKGKYRVTAFAEPANTVIAQSTTGHGCFAVADPRLDMQRGSGDDYVTAGHYGIVPWTDSCGAISAAASHDNGRWNVADPRIDCLPEASSKMIAVIRALDGAWHRPFTTLELAALQSLVDPEEVFDLEGNSDSAKRERIGNAVPPCAAQAIADMMGETILLAMVGEQFVLSASPIWGSPRGRCVEREYADCNLKICSVPFKAVDVFDGHVKHH